MRKTSCLTGCLLVLAAVAFVHADDWTLVGNDHGITVYRRDVPGSAVVALKGEGLIDAPVWKVASVLLDTKRAPEWVDSLKASAVVRRLTPTSYVEYNHLKLPLLIKDRDFVSEVQIDIRATDRSVTLVYKPTDDPDAPATHNVRGEILAGTFRASAVDATHTTLVAEIQCDPKGALPAWAVNLFQKGWPRHTFEGIRKQVARADVTMPDEFKDVLEPTRDF
jgi:hypothetical protein